VSAFGVDGFNIHDRCAQILGSYRAIPRDVYRAVAPGGFRHELERAACRRARGSDAGARGATPKLAGPMPKLAGPMPKLAAAKFRFTGSVLQLACPRPVRNFTFTSRFKGNWVAVIAA